MRIPQKQILNHFPYCILCHAKVSSAAESLTEEEKLALVNAHECQALKNRLADLQRVLCEQEVELASLKELR